MVCVVTPSAACLRISKMCITMRIDATNEFASTCMCVRGPSPPPPPSDEIVRCALTPCLIYCSLAHAFATAEKHVPLSQHSHPGRTLRATQRTLTTDEERGSCLLWRQRQCRTVLRNYSTMLGIRAGPRLVMQRMDASFLTLADRGCRS
jgi:hypothetical protein